MKRISLIGLALTIIATQVPWQTSAQQLSEQFLISSANGPNAGVNNFSLLCNGIPSAGNTIASVNPVCPDKQFTLSLSEPFSPDYSYQWQVSSDSSYWGIVEANYSGSPDKYLTSQNEDLYYRCKITCVNSGLISYSTPVKVFVKKNFGPTECYCSSMATDYNDISDIVNVKLGSLNNSSACSTLAGGYSIAGKYSDYTTLPPAEINKNTPFDIAVSVLACASQNNYYNNESQVKIFVDLNHNGLLTDAGENVFTSSLFNTGYTGDINVLKGLITLPLSADTGRTLMRVITYKATDSYYVPCGTYYYNGETEDYFIRILPETACSGLFNPGKTISSADSICLNVSYTVSYENVAALSGISKQWESSTDSITWTPIAGATSFSYTTAQTITKYYRCKFTCANSGQTSYSEPKKVKIKAFYTCYPSSNTGWGEFDNIWNVQLASLNNSSTCASTTSDYRFSVPAPEIAQGATVPIHITVGNCQTAIYLNQLSVFIDFNHDGAFDSNEKVLTRQFGSNSSGLVFNGLISVPNNALTGLTGMRIQADEIEDYLINILPITPCSGVPDPGKTIASPEMLFQNPLTAIPITLSIEKQQTEGGISYQWEYSSNGTNWAPASNASSSSYITYQGFFYRCKVSCSYTGLFAYSTPIKVISYCPSYSYYADDEEIYNVTVGDLNNNSDCNTLLPSPSVKGSYSNYSSIPPTNIMQGGAISFSVKAGTCGYSYGCFIKIFIDYNHNGSFEDAGETVYISPVFNPTVSGVIRSGSFIVPTNALAGITGMRVVLIESASPGSYGPCSVYNWGETEDYIVNIMSATPCSGIPVPGNTLFNCSGLSLQNKDQLNIAGIVYQWQSSIDNISWDPIIGATSQNYNSPLTILTYYRCKVSCTTNGQESFSAPFRMTINSLADCYCMPTLIYNSINSDFADITNVHIEAINNSSTCSTAGPGNSNGNVYSNYINSVPSTNLQQGAILPFSVSTAACFADYHSFVVKVYIDLNQNGNFNDPNEKLFVSVPFITTSTGKTINSTLQIPFSALAGNTIMRIVFLDSSNQLSDACGGFYSGEVEDYLVNIVPAIPCSGSFDPGNTMTQFNPFCIGDSILLKIQNHPTESGITYQWESSIDNINWSTIIGKTDSICKVKFTGTTYYHCITTCTNTSQTAISVPLQVTPIASVAAPPYTENFELMPIVGDGVVPCSWSTETTGDYNWKSVNSPVGGIGARSGNNFLYFPNTSYNSNPFQAWVYTKGISLTAGVIYKISFYYQNEFEKNIIVAAGSGQNVSQMTDILLNISVPSSGYIYKQIWTSFTAPSSGIYYFGIGINSISTFNSSWLDDFTIEQMPECNMPIFLRGSAVANNLNIAWNCDGCTGDYIVEYGPPGFTPGSGNTAGNSGTAIVCNSTSLTISGLLFQTDYDVYVRKICQPGNFSGNEGPLKITTKSANDIITGSILLNCGYQSISANPVFALNDTLPSLCGVISGNVATNGLWYKIAGNNKTHSLSVYNARVAVYSGVPGNLSCVTGENPLGTAAYPYNNYVPAQVRFYANQGMDYYVLIFGGTNTSTSQYILNHECYDGNCFPENDECINATQLQLIAGTESFTYGNNSCATRSPIINPPAFGLCGDTHPITCLGGCPYGPSQLFDVWYKFNTGTTTQIQLYLSNAGLSQGISGTYYYAIYSGDCTNPVYKSCGQANLNGITVLSGLSTNTNYSLRLYISSWPDNYSKGLPGNFKIMLRAFNNLPYCLSLPSEPLNGELNRCIGGQYLKWSAVAGATGYDVYLNAGNSNPTTLVASNTNSTSYYVSSLLPNTTYYWKVVPRNSYGIASGCNIFSFQTGNHPCYCSTSYLEQFISNVSLETLNNSSNCSTNPFISNYKNLTPVLLNKKGLYSISITIASCRTLYSNSNTDAYIKVFIDFNQDGDFVDPGEEVMFEMHPNLYLTNTATITGSIYIPATALTGVTEMRVAAGIGYSTFTSCSVYPGEIEEYLINIQPLLVCNTSVLPGNITGNNSVCAGGAVNLRLNNFTSGADLQWQKATSPVGPWIDIPGATINVLTTDPLTIPTYFRTKVDCGNTDYTNPFLVSLKNYTECYCSYNPANYGDHHPDIVSVKLGPLNKQTYDGNPSVYNDYSGSGIYEFFRTISYDFSAMVATSYYSGQYTSVAVFMDLNHNSSFNDPGEMIFSGGPVQARLWGTKIIGNITIPQTADTGITRLRIVAQENYYSPGISGCWDGGYFYGTIEDFTIQIRDCSSLPLPTIGASDISNNFCNGIQLTVNSSVPVNTYAWSNGQTAQSINLTTADPPGIYSVNINYTNDCSASASYTYNPQLLISSYTLLAKTSMKLQQNNTVVNGSAGVVNATGSASIKKNVSIAGPGAFLKSKNISLQSPYNIPTIVNAAATVALPVMQFNTTSTSGLSNVNVSNGSTITISGNRKNITIGKNCNVTLTGSIFGNISIDEKSNVRFTQSLLNIASIDMQEGSNNNPTRLRFSSDAIVRCSGDITVRKKSQVNPENFKVIIYLGKSNSSADFTVGDGGNITVNASMYIPKGTLSVGGDDNDNTYMNGKFIAEKIETLGKKVIWNWYDCSTTAPPTITNNNNQFVLEDQTAEPVNRLTVKAWPNPSEHVFTLGVQSNSNQVIEIRVYDMFGRIVYSTTGYANRQYQIGSNLVSGTYVAEVRQGANHSTVKLIKQ